MLNLYRRHSAECKVHALSAKVPAKNRKKFIAGYRDCDCWIWMYGSTDTAMYPRQTTKCRDWKDAEAYRNSLEAESKSVEVHGLTIAAYNQKFLDTTASLRKPNTQRDYEFLLERLQKYAADNNKFRMHELDASFFDDFKTYGLQNLADTSKTTAMKQIKCYLRKAFSVDQIPVPLAAKVPSHPSVYEPKSPYTPDEVERLLAGAESLINTRVAYGSNGLRFRLFMEFILQTGMRAGDAIRFLPYDSKDSGKDRLVPSFAPGFWSYTFVMQKTGTNKIEKPVTVMITNRLKEDIDAIRSEWMSQDRPFANLLVVEKEVVKKGEKPKDRTSDMVNLVREHMQRIGKKFEIDDCRPHRLRDTFVVQASLRKPRPVPIETISRMLGHSDVNITIKYYRKWIPALQQNLEETYAASFAA